MKKKKSAKPTLIILGIAIVVILCMFIAQPVLAWVSENKGILLASLFAVVVVAVALFVWWLRERRKKQEEAFYRVVDTIKALKYYPTFREERPYHSMTYGYLIGKGFDVKWEVGTGASRPDLVVDGVAIEVKGPTDSMALQTLSHKVMKYSNHYKFLIVVLFDCICSKYTLDETLMGIAKMVRGKVKLEVITKRAV